MNTTKQRQSSLLLLGLGLLLLALWSCESKADIEPPLSGEKRINCGLHHVDVSRDTMPTSSPLFIDITLDSMFYDTCQEVVCIDGVCDTIWKAPVLIGSSITTIRVNVSGSVVRLIGRHSLCMVGAADQAIILGDGIFSLMDTFFLPNSLFSLNISTNDWVRNSDILTSRPAFYNENIQNLVQESIYSDYDQSIYYVGGNRMMKYDMALNTIAEEITFNDSLRTNSNIVYDNVSQNLYFLVELASGGNGAQKLARYALATQQLSFIEMDTNFILHSKPAIAWSPQSSSLFIFASYTSKPDFNFHYHTMLEYDLAANKYEARSFFNPRFNFTDNETIIYNPERNSIFALEFGSLNSTGNEANGIITIWEFDLSDNQWRQHNTTSELNLTLKRTNDFYNQSTFRVVQDLSSKILLISFIDNRCFKYDYEREVVDIIPDIPVN